MEETTRLWGRTNAQAMQEAFDLELGPGKVVVLAADRPGDLVDGDRAQSKKQRYGTQQVSFVPASAQKPLEHFTAPAAA